MGNFIVGVLVHAKTKSADSSQLQPAVTYLRNFITDDRCLSGLDGSESIAIEAAIAHCAPLEFVAQWRGKFFGATALKKMIGSKAPKWWIGNIEASQALAPGFVLPNKKLSEKTLPLGHTGSHGYMQPCSFCSATESMEWNAVKNGSWVGSVGRALVS